MPSFREVYRGNYLTKEECGSGLKFDIRGIEVVEFDDGAKLVANNGSRSWVVNVTNSEALARIFGTNDFDHWRGTVELFHDQNVRYGTVRGGIRVRELPESSPREPLLHEEAAPPPVAYEATISAAEAADTADFSADAKAYLDDLAGAERHGAERRTIAKILHYANEDFAAGRISQGELMAIIDRAGRLQTAS